MSGSTTSQPGKLYTPRLLGLSAGLAEFPFDNRFEYQADARSRTCGSTITLGLDCDRDQVVSRIGMQVTACAIGQSSAAILANAVRGVPVARLTSIHAEIVQWLDGDAGTPDWPEFDALEPAVPHPGRHGALLLPWNAAIEALSSRTGNS